MGRRANAGGFTLIELMITLVITGIMLAVGLPAFNGMVMNTKLRGQIDELSSMLNYARSTALSQASPVQVCPVGSPGSTTCGTNWATGWMVVTAPNAAGVNPVLLQSHTSPVTVTLNAQAGLAGVVFDPHGLSTTAAHFAVCDSRGASYSRTLMVNATGFVQTAPSGNVTAWGSAATCTP